MSPPKEVKKERKETIPDGADAIAAAKAAESDVTAIAMAAVNDAAPQNISCCHYHCHCHCHCCRCRQYSPCMTHHTSYPAENPDTLEVQPPLIVGEKTVVVPTDKPVLDKPVLEKPGLEKPGLEKPGLEKPGLEKPVPQKPILEKPVLEKPILEKPALDKALHEI